LPSHNPPNGQREFLRCHSSAIFIQISWNENIDRPRALIVDRVLQPHAEEPAFGWQDMCIDWHVECSAARAIISTDWSGDNLVDARQGVSATESIANLPCCHADAFEKYSRVDTTRRPLFMNSTHTNPHPICSITKAIWSWAFHPELMQHHFTPRASRQLLIEHASYSKTAYPNGTQSAICNSRTKLPPITMSLPAQPWPEFC
jgi:hypothetical protein